MQEEIELYKKDWWMFFVGGLITLLFGIVAVVNPAQTTASLGFFFGVYLLVGGAIEVVQSLTSAKAKSLWLLHLILGSLQVLIGIYILQRPLLALKTLIAFIALALLLRAVIHFVEVFDSAYDAVYRTWQGVAAVISLMACIVIWRYPIQGTLAFVWVLGVFALINGPILIAFSLEAKNGFSKSKAS